MLEKFRGVIRMAVAIKRRKRCDICGRSFWVSSRQYFRAKYCPTCKKEINRACVWARRHNIDRSNLSIKELIELHEKRKERHRKRDEVAAKIKSKKENKSEPYYCKRCGAPLPPGRRFNCEDCAQEIADECNLDLDFYEDATISGLELEYW